MSSSGASAVEAGNPTREPPVKMRKRPTKCFVRVLPSQCALLCDGARPATLLGALPGLSPAAMAQHEPDADAQARGFRLIAKSFELDVLATSAQEARFWIRGVNTLPFGSKHCALLALARKHHPNLVKVLQA